MLSLSLLVKKYGLIALAFLHIAVSRGLHGTFSVFFVAMVTAFGWSRAMTAGAISLAIVFEGACLPLAGALTDRIGGRKTLILGGLVLAVGLGFCFDNFFHLAFLFLGWDYLRIRHRLSRHGASRGHFVA